MSRPYTISETETKRRSDQMKAMHAEALVRQQASVAARDVGAALTRRFFGSDLEEMGPWLLTRLKAKYANLNELNYVGFFRGCMSGNEWLFLRTDHAVGLANLRYEPLNPVAYVEEVFVLCKEGPEPRRAQQEEMLDIYRHFRDWMESHGARLSILDRFTDLPLGMLKKEFEGRLRTETRLLLIRPKEA